MGFINLRSDYQCPALCFLSSSPASEHQFSQVQGPEPPITLQYNYNQNTNETEIGFLFCSVRTLRASPTAVGFFSGNLISQEALSLASSTAPALPRGCVISTVKGTVKDLSVLSALFRLSACFKGLDNFYFVQPSFSKLSFLSFHPSFLLSFIIFFFENFMYGN